MIRRSATNDLAIPKNDSESNTFSKWPFAEKSFTKKPPTLSTRKQTEYSNIPNSLDKLDSSLFKNKYSLVGDPETVAHNSIEPLLEDKVTRDLLVNIRFDPRKMETSLTSGATFCKSLSFRSAAELKASTTVGLNSQNSHRSTDIFEQKNVNTLREVYGNTLNRPSQETNNVKPFDDFLAKSNMNFQGNRKGSYFWSTLSYDSKKDEHSNKLGYPHIEKKNSTYDIANKENLPFRKERFFKRIFNTCLNSTESKDITNTLNMDAQDRVRLIHNANNVRDTNCFGTTNLISEVLEESPVKENNDLVAGKPSTTCNCQSAICCKDDIQSTSQIMSRSQTNMEVIPPSTHSTSYLSNSNAIVTNTRGNLNNPSSLDNETLTTLNRIYESNKWKVNSGAVTTTHISDNMRIPNLISKNASKPLRKLDEIESDNEKNVNVAERLFCNEAPFQCTDETAKSLVRSPNSRYLYSYQNKPNDRLKENDTSKNNKNETFCSQEFRCDSYEFPTQQTLTQTHQTYAENNGIFCSRNDCFTQPQSILRNSQENRVTCKNSETSRTVNWSPTSILYEDNLLKQLLDEKPDIIKSYNKRKSEDKQLENQDGIMAKTYIKKYRKNNIRIYKIKRRFRTSVEETYVPKEHKLINKFLNQAEGDSGNELLNENEDSESITTSSSYLTDETTPDDLSSDTKNRTEYQTFLGNSINRILKDKSLIFSKFSDTVPLEINSSDVLTKIEEIMVQLLSDYECGKSISLNIPSIANCVFRDDRYQLVDLTRRHYVLRRHTPSNRLRFNLILFILNKIRILLHTNSKLTKREIYYQLKTDVCTQRHTDSAIRIISRMLNVGMWALNITAQKGLVYGNMKLVMDTGETINCNVAGTLVPNDVMNICEIQSQAFFILVVEKESIFNKLLEEDLPNKLTKPFILITGKGYPDLNTQLFLKKLWMVMEIPVFIFVDADPDGISIMLTYRFGSKTNVHLSEYLAIPKAKWIGVFPTEILNVGANYEILNNREERKATSLLQLQCVQENPKIQKQIQTCLDTGVKASIEALIKSESYLSNQYLPSKFLQNDLI
ncbi:uncharacterized protein LOC125503043 [Dendroctonus ponderosae]|uniref:uncharacterized protein LOC125503034 n=1 Tax=Dendroctonus ponderosae TaxID=77166 RepID=UPI00203593E5|nr:uncharacterized protein LOC125503034 [Dendroctonus ponderosae]XP_048518730.1 uncharacterized protein LOC125503043 [Dendroctonus ponderosae]